MMAMNIFYQGGGFEVSSTILRTPRKTYKLAQVEFVSVQRPLLLFAGLPALGTTGLCVSFWRYLFISEILTLSTVSILAIIIAARFGMLRVHSLALRDDDVGLNFGTIQRLRAVRAAVEQAMTLHMNRDGEKE